MRILLDTHCLIWALTDPPALGQTGRDALARAEGAWFSEASIWEIGLKWRKGKIGIEPRRIFEQALRDGFRAQSLDVEVLILSCELRQAHDDPFDCLLYAQAKHHGFRLLTMDRTLSTFGSRIAHPR